MKYLCKIIAVLLNSLFCIANPGFAETINLSIVDQSGNAVKNAVISAHLLNEPEKSTSNVAETVIIDQIDKKFINSVTPIQVGTAINFPNYDQIRHHVYSLSTAKTFEIPLYKGIPADLIVFDQEGVVVLGCNIHDNMSAYVVVIDSPYFTTTDERGEAKLDVPMGEYELRFWHRDMDQQSKKTKQQINVVVGESKKISTELEITPSWSSKGLPFSINNRGRYR